MNFFRHSSLRVAYIDEGEEKINGKSEKVFYSVLVKGGEKLDEVQRLATRRLKCPWGEKKLENDYQPLSEVGKREEWFGEMYFYFLGFPWNKIL